MIRPYLIPIALILTTGAVLVSGCRPDEEEWKPKTRYNDQTSAAPSASYTPSVPATGATPASTTYGPYTERIAFATPTRYGESGTRGMPTLRAPLTVEYVMCKLQTDGGYLWSFMDRNYAGREWKGSVHLALLSEDAEIYSQDIEVDQRNPSSQEAYAAGAMLTQFETRTAPISMGGNIVGYRYTVTPVPDQPTTGYINPASLPQIGSEPPEENSAEDNASQAQQPATPAQRYRVLTEQTQGQAPPNIVIPNSPQATSSAPSIPASQWQERARASALGGGDYTGIEIQEYTEKTGIPQGPEPTHWRNLNRFKAYWGVGHSSTQQRH